MIIILLGAPGSGKGTQAKMVATELAIPHISTGDLFRDHLSKNTDLGKQVSSYLRSGQYVPDEVVLAMIEKRVILDDCSNGYLMDGFPRTIAQAKALSKMMAKRAFLTTAIQFCVEDEVIVKRIVGRLSCKSCHTLYNAFFFPPKEQGRCDKCGGRLYQRPDDHINVVEERLKNYQNQTVPLIDYYKEKNVLTAINGVEEPQTIFKKIMGIISSVSCAATCSDVKER